MEIIYSSFFFLATNLDFFGHKCGRFCHDIERFSIPVASVCPLPETLTHPVIASVPLADLTFGLQSRG